MINGGGSGVLYHEKYKIPYFIVVDRCDIHEIDSFMSARTVSDLYKG